MLPAVTIEQLTSELAHLRQENQILNQIVLQQAIKIENFSLSQNPAQGNLYFSKFYKLWLQAHKNNIQQSTFYEYSAIAENHILPYFDKQAVLLCEVKAQDIESYYLYKQRSGVSDSFLVRHHANLHTCFKYALKHDYITANPMDKVKRPKVNERYLANYYNIEQLIELFELAKSSEIYTPILLAGLLGLRRSEVIGLKWETINFAAGTIAIRRKAVKDKAKKQDVISTKLKTIASYRVLPLPPALLSYLKKLKKHQAQQAKSVNYSKEYLEYICLKADGNRISLDKVTNDFRRLIQRHGLDKIRFHDLRHSCATMLLHLNYNMKQIQEWLGHSNYQTTANIYTHVNVKDKEEMALTINRSINLSL